VTRRHALKSGQLSAPLAAIKEKGVLSGHRIERNEVGASGGFDHLSQNIGMGSLNVRNLACALKFPYLRAFWTVP
jgi:hypothetical protein